MNFNIPDPLKNNVPNTILRIFIYFFILFISIFVFLALIILLGPILLALFVMFLSFKKISDEKVKWTVITVLTISILIAGTYKSSEVQPSSSTYIEKPISQNTAKEEGNIDTKTSQNDNDNLSSNTNDDTSSLEQFQGFSGEEVNSAQSSSDTSNQNLNQQSNLFLVTKVIDGDTIEIEGGKRVRYIGIDTPETVHPSKPVECYGKEASNKNLELVLNKRVKLEKDVSETDKYGRLLRYVYIGDIFVNDYLVREGFAKASTYPPDVKHNEKFLQSQKFAIDNDKGLWSSACEVSSSTPSTQNSDSKSFTSSESENSVTESSDEIVKKSSTGICHAPGTSYYSRTKNFTPYNSIEECLDSGGRLPKR